MNLKRILIGGLVAGVVINIVETAVNGIFLGARWSAWAAALGPLDKPPAQNAARGLWAVVALAWGLAAVWLYAALLRRFPHKLQAVLYTALTLWVLGWVLNAVEQVALGDIPHDLLLWGCIAGLISSFAGAGIAAAIYREDRLLVS